MMKKVVAIFFLTIYSFTTVGATVHMHYCMNKLIGTSFYHSKKNTCENCGMHKSATKGCCKDEHKFIKLEREHQQTQSAETLSFLSTPVIVTAVVTYHQAAVSLFTANTSIDTSPPDIQSQKLYLLNRVFRI